jgi:cell fate (sporulation/competence/biofilm development) regulator YlbF (YheA/YmcA/DUF963 family)
VLEKTRELCQTLVSQPGFVALQRNVEAFLADDGAKRLYQDLVGESERLQQKQRQGTPLTQEEIAGYETQREALERNELARDFMAAQQQMQSLQQTISRYVNKTMELGRVPGPEDFGSCGHGCSCGH